MKLTEIFETAKTIAESNDWFVVSDEDAYEMACEYYADINEEG